MRWPGKRSRRNCAAGPRSAVPALPIAGAIVGGVGMVKNSDQIGKILSGKKEIDAISGREDVEAETQGVAKYAAG